MTFIPKNDQGVSYIQPSYNYRDDRPTAPKRRSPRLKSSANRLSSSAITFSVSMTAAVAASRIWAWPLGRPPVLSPSATRRLTT
jgi:hypothetical protein